MDDSKISNQVYEIICYINKYKKIVNNPNWDGLLKFNKVYYLSPDKKNYYYKFIYNDNKTKITVTFKDIDDIISYIFEYPTEICNYPPNKAPKLIFDLN